MADGSSGRDRRGGAARTLDGWTDPGFRWRSIRASLLRLLMALVPFSPEELVYLPRCGRRAGPAMAGLSGSTVKWRRPARAGAGKFRSRSSNR